MLPPIDPSLLSSCPKFATLYTHLTKKVLNSNGSTKNHPSQKERDTVSEKLKRQQTLAAQKQLLIHTLHDLDLSSPPPTNPTAPPTSKHPKLPHELLELTILLTSHLHAPSIQPATQKLLESTQQWASLSTHLPLLSQLASAHLHHLSLQLCRIHSPTTNPSYLHRQIPKLLPSIQTLQKDIAEKKATLEVRRRELVDKTTLLLTLYAQASTLTILHLEQVTHGLLSRHIKSKSEYLSLLAKYTAGEAKEKLRRGESMVYTEDVKMALGNYLQNLRVEKRRLEERGDGARRVLRGYGVGREDTDKERTMRSIARKYAEMEREKEEVGRDVLRLKGR